MLLYSEVVCAYTLGIVIKHVWVQLKFSKFLCCVVYLSKYESTIVYVFLWVMFLLCSVTMSLYELVK